MVETQEEEEEEEEDREDVDGSIRQGKGKGKANGKRRFVAAGMVDVRKFLKVSDTIRVGTNHPDNETDVAVRK